MKATTPAAPSAVVSVAIYTRVSTDNQLGGRFDSCDSQAAICRECVAKHAAEGWQEVACYKDAAYSGGTMDRPGIKALKRQIEAGEVKVVLIFKLERVLRSTDEWVPFRAFLQKHGCRLESATEDISENTPSGRLKNNLLMSVAEYERLNTAEKTRAKMLEQAKRGLWNGGMVPYGYAYDEKTQTLHPHPTEARVLQCIFEQAARLVSLTELANVLNAEGLRTKERVWRHRDGTAEAVGGGLFRSDGLRLLIRNPIYHGAVKFAGKEYAGQHEALVGQEVWEKANAAVAHTKPRPDARMQLRDTHHHLLKGLAHCGGCGRALVPHDSGKKDEQGMPYRYYACGKVLRERNAAACEVRRLSADALERVVVVFLGEVSRHPAVIASAVEASQVLKKKDRPVLLAELAPLQRKLDSVTKQLKNCMQAVAMGGVEVMGDMFTAHVNELRNERQQLLVARERKQQEIAACDAARLNAQRIQQSIEQFGVLLPRLTAIEQKELVQLFIERLDVRRVLSNAAERRLLELRFRLHLPRLVEGMEQKVLAVPKATPAGALPAPRGLSLTARVDFTDAARGEVAIVAPFQQVVRLETRVREVPVPVTAVEHPIKRALQWQEMLTRGEVANRVELAQRAGVTPGAVTHMLKLVQLIPEIRDYLASLKTANAVWHFSTRRMEELVNLPPTQQRAKFAAMQQKYAVRTGIG
jgi:DNA invertase Pin-like site-specific DNA recombinase